MKISDRLVERLHDDGLFPNLPPGTRAKRIMQGRHGRAAGGWRWCLYYPDNGPEMGVGGADTMRECVDADHLVLSHAPWSHDIEVTAEEKP